MLYNAIALFRERMGLFPEVPQKTARLIFEQTLQRKPEKVCLDHAERFGVFADKMESDLIWLDDKLPKKKLQFVHAFDKRMMFLSAARSAYFGVGDFEEIGKVSLTDEVRKMVGLVELQKLKWKTDPKSAFIARIIGEKETRFYTPYLPFIEEFIDGPIKIKQGWIWRKPQKLFEKFAVRLGDEIKALRPENLEGIVEYPDDPIYQIVASSLKKMYVSFFGWLGRIENRQWSTELFRPDWRGLIVSMAAVNLFRNILAIYDHSGKFPFAINHDCIMYLSESPGIDEFDGCVATDKLRFTHEWSAGSPYIYEAIKDGKNATQIDSLGKKLAEGLNG